MLVRRLGFLLPLLLPPLVVAGAALGGAGTWLVPAFIFGVLPVADALLGEDGVTVAPRGTVGRGWRAYFDAILYAWLPIQLALIIWGAAAAGAAWRPGAGGPLTVTGLVVSIGILTGGIGITIAHELGHRRGRVDRALSCLLLASVSYAHFHIEHNQGHHAHVATPLDPATARRGESFYRFLPRTLRDSFAGAWRIERARLAAAGRGSASPRNRMLWFVAAPLAFAGALGLAFGAAAAAFFAAQSAVAFTLLELVNYLEHYGLERRRGPDGRYERVRPEHSWNSSQRLTNWYLFNLQRHSHHHAHVTRHYEELEHVPGAPQLPTGYAAMVLLALVPPLWHRVMDPRLAVWQRALRAAPAA